MNRFQITILGCWGALLLIVIAIVVLADMLGPAARNALLPVTANALEFILGAVVGALTTLMANSKFTEPSERAPTEED